MTFASNMTTCAKPAKPLTVKDMLGWLEKMPPALPRFELHINPKNVHLIKEALDAKSLAAPHRRVESFSIADIPMHYSDTVPERDLREQWFPPAGDRFCEYGPEDEHWMRPLGLGTVKTIDFGPLIIQMQERFTMRVMEMCSVAVRRPGLLETCP